MPALGSCCIVRVSKFSLLCVHMYSLQEYSGDNSDDLFLEEREAQLKVAAKEKRQQQLSVPGIINPHDRPDEMQE